MKTRVAPYVLAATAASLLALAASPALAGPECTKEPKSKWLTEEQMMGRIKDMGFRDIKNFHVSKGQCYEIYGYDKDGKKVEVYFHPITGQVAELKKQ